MPLHMVAVQFYIPIPWMPRFLHGHLMVVWQQQPQEPLQLICLFHTVIFVSSLTPHLHSHEFSSPPDCIILGSTACCLVLENKPSASAGMTDSCYWCTVGDLWHDFSHCFPSSLSVWSTVPICVLCSPMHVVCMSQSPRAYCSKSSVPPPLGALPSHTMPNPSQNPVCFLLAHACPGVWANSSPPPPNGCCTVLPVI